jgi:hypothetical protein
MNHPGTRSRASKRILTLLSALSIALVGTLALLGRSHRRIPAHHQDRSLERFRQAILNNTRQNVAAVLGPPHAAIMIDTTSAGASPAPPATHWWQAETWYYPLNRRRRAALAIRFQNHQAREVHIVRTPR